MAPGSAFAPKSLRARVFIDEQAEPYALQNVRRRGQADRDGEDVPAGYLPPWWLLQTLTHGIHMQITRVGSRPIAILATSVALIMALAACGDTRVGRIGVLTGPGTGTGSTGTGTGTKTDTTAVASVSVSPTSPTIAVGATTTFGAIARNSSGKSLTATMSWSTSSSSVATINGSGVATGVAAGTTTITATSGNVSGSATLTVTR